MSTHRPEATMDLTVLPSAITQILYFTIPPSNDLKDASSEAGKKWLQALNEIEGSAGYERLFWGRSVEQPEKVQLHVVRSSIEEHKSHLASASLARFLEHVTPLVNATVQPVVRHVTSMHNYTSTPTTPFHAPVTGATIYVRTTFAWDEGAWPCWTHIVRHVKECTGIAGGKLLEPFRKEDSASLAGASPP